MSIVSVNATTSVLAHCITEAMNVTADNNYEWLIRSILIGIGAGLLTESLTATIGLILFGFGVAGGVRK